MDQEANIHTHLKNDGDGFSDCFHEFSQQNCNLLSQQFAILHSLSQIFFMQLLSRPLLLLLFAVFTSCQFIIHDPNNELPPGFVYLSQIHSNIRENLRYATTDNFLGRKVVKYEGKSVICTEQAAYALANAQNRLEQLGYQLVIYDAYRPVSSTESFVEWAEDPRDINQTSQELYYPFINKSDIIPDGYIAQKSGHNRGSTIDLTIIEIHKEILPITKKSVFLQDGTQLQIPFDNTVDMGTAFDLFHEASHHGTSLVSERATKNREVLKQIMMICGFKPLPEQWWHYTLVYEPYPQTYFDFPITDPENYGKQSEN